MATMEERLKILQMVQEGKITPEDAAQLLDAINAGSTTQGSVPPRRAGPINDAVGGGGPVTPGRKPRFLRVRVTDTDSGRPRVNVRLPISMVTVGLKMGSKFAPQIEGLDADQLMQIIESGELGQIVDVVDDEDGEHVEVFLE
jgi:hypothetical protein